MSKPIRNKMALLRSCDEMRWIKDAASSAKHKNLTKEKEDRYRRRGVLVTARPRKVYIGRCATNILLHNSGTAERGRTSDMATFNKFGIIPVARSLDGMLQKEVAFPSEEEAKRPGKIFADVLGGAVAFRRINDPDTGIVGQGVVIGEYGVTADAESAPIAAE